METFLFTKKIISRERFLVNDKFKVEGLFCYLRSSYEIPKSSKLVTIRYPFEHIRLETRQLKTMGKLKSLIFSDDSILFYSYIFIDIENM